MGRYVATTYRLHNCMWILSGYVSTTYPKYKLMSKCWNKCLSEWNHSSWVSLNVFTGLISVRWTWGVLCWGDRLTAGFADVLRHSPLFWKGHSQAQSSLQFSGRWRWRCRARRNKVYPSGFVTWVESIVVSCRLRRLPAVEGAYAHWRRRYWGGSDGSGDCGL